MSDPRTYTLTLSCPDRLGIVAAVSQFVTARGGWIIEANHHAEQEDNVFFMRQVILADSLNCSVAQLRAAFEPLAKSFGMTWSISDSAVKKRMVVMVSKQEHCIYDLLGRWHAGELPVDIPCVISNHETFRGLVEWHGIPFHHVPVTPENKPQAYRQVMDIFDTAQADLMVLARYMQVLSPEMCERYAGRIINIHHSFLPSFVGAKPYHQAHDRGVKLIGATCHYVTADLDQGPIIEQDVIRIDHSDLISDLVRYGKDIEKAVLARGLRFHLEDRVIVHKNKTIVFR
ncbi:formyltetrahydrofolate deformylase (plasmid) [Aquabacterium olei]|uniref:Formyltetrahydrofolate deformylase n=1 Tax=Aquabacterium olei TaxID=1296669 RepID=A0A2U8FWU8_9BURK|nr:formyltetrahydrofolate deformylase [Aquabacterium olei]AWI55377.1 formyltetrahydrofolate deformylase [Aquabacterium olei]